MGNIMEFIHLKAFRNGGLWWCDECDRYTDIKSAIKGFGIANPEEQGV